MTSDTHRLRRRSIGALGIAATLALAAASTASATTEPPGTEGPDASAAPEGAASLDELTAAATQEGTVNLIALPDTWANYAGVIATFGEKYPDIDHPVQAPDASSAEEIVAVETQRGSDTMPDVLDVSPAVALQAVEDGIFDPYMPTLWDEIPENLRDPDGNWVGAYYGIMAIGVNTTLVETVPASFAELNNPDYEGMVSLNGDPRESGAAFAAVMAASLANGGSFDDIMPGIQYFADLKAAGVLNEINMSEASVLAGETPIVLDWTYNFPGLIPKIEEAGFTFASAVPSDAVYGAYYAQGVVADSPHPNAARLWIEHILSDEGALEYLEGGAIPARYATLVENGTITDDMLANLPAPELIDQVSFPNADQFAAAQQALAANWGPMVTDA